MNIDLMLAEHLPAAIRETRQDIAEATDDMTALRAKLHRLEDIANAAGVSIDGELAVGPVAQAPARPEAA